MQLQTKRFGTIEVDEDSALEVPNGIPGFPDMHRVVLMSAAAVTGHADDPSDQSLYWLQDLDDGGLAFLCVVPWVPFPEYDFEFTSEDYGIDDEADVRILNLITAHRDEAGSSLTANLRAPLLVDVRRQRLHQVILSDTRWPISAPLPGGAGTRASSVAAPYAASRAAEVR